MLPLSRKVGEAQRWPNYQLHLIGEDMTYVAMRGMYEDNGVSSPALWSIATTATYYLMNEIVENGPFSGPTVDPIAHIYIFDIGEIILFSYDGVNRLFYDELRMADWPLQPSFVPGPLTLQNNAQYFSIRWKLPFAEQYSMFYYFGLRGMHGVSRENSDGESASAGFAMRQSNSRRSIQRQISRPSSSDSTQASSTIAITPSSYHLCSATTPTTL